MNKIKAIFLNIGLLAISFIIAWLLLRFDKVFLDLANYRSSLWISIGVIVIIVGLVIRLWASYTFYSHGLKVLALKPQHQIVQSGPYKYSRNPLYIGIILIFLGWVLFLGSNIGLVTVAILAVLFHLDLILSGEKELEQKY